MADSLSTINQMAEEQEFTGLPENLSIDFVSSLI
jgi:hypothetical protein